MQLFNILFLFINFSYYLKTSVFYQFYKSTHFSVYVSETLNVDCK